MLPDGSPHRTWYTAEGLAHHLIRQVVHPQVADLQAQADTELGDVDGFGHPAATRIRPAWRGEPFDLHECVQALFRMPPSEGRPAEAA